MDDDDGVVRPRELDHITGREAALAVGRLRVEDNAVAEGGHADVHHHAGGPAILHGQHLVDRLLVEAQRALARAAIEVLGALALTTREHVNAHCLDSLQRLMMFLARALYINKRTLSQYRCAILVSIYA